MSNIDERIVEMKFDNHLFNKNVESSVSVLERLEEALKFKGVEKSLSNIESSVNDMDFSKVESNVDSLSKRFTSLFGMIKGKIKEDIAGSIADSLEKVMKVIPTKANQAINQVITGGQNRARKIDQAKFKMEGLKVAWEDIKDDIDYAVDNTAFGLDSAASAASQLLASGVEFGKTFGDKGNSPMAKALRGISGVASMTSSSYDEIAPIFTKVAGNGRLFATELNSLSSRGINAAATIAKYLAEVKGQAGATEETVHEMTRKGQIDFEIFSEAMNWAYGEQATKANETFEGSLDNMKAALSRIGAEFFTPYRKNMTDVFNAIRPIFNNIKNVLSDFDADNNTLGMGTFTALARLMESLKTLVVGTLGFVNSHMGALQSVAGFLTNAFNGAADAVDKVTSALGFLGTAAKEGSEDAADAILKTADTSSEAYKEYQDTIAEFEKLGVDKSQTVFGNIDLNARQVLEWTKETVAQYEDVLKSWGELDPDSLIGTVSTVFGSSSEWDGVEIAFSPMLQATDGSDKPVLLSQDTVDKYIGQLIDNAGEGWTAEALIELDKKGLDIDGQHISKILADIGDTAITTGEAMHFLGEDGAINQALKKLAGDSKEAITSLEDVDTLIDRIWAGEFGNGEERFAAIDALYGVEGAGHAVQNRLNELAGVDFRYADACDISALATKKEGESLEEAAKKVDSFSETKEGLIGTLQTIKESISNAFKDAMPKVIVWLVSAVTGLKSAFSIFGKVIGSIAKGAISGLISILGTVGDVLGSITSMIFDGITGFALWAQEAGVWEGVEKFFKSVFDAISNVISVMGDFVKLGFQGVKTVFGKIGDTIAGAVDRVKEFWGSLKESEGFVKLSSTFNKIKETFGNIKDTIFDAIKGFFEDVAGSDVKFPEFDISAAVDKVSEAFSWLSDNVLSKVADKLESIQDTLSSWGGSIYEFLFGKDIELNGWEGHIPGFLDEVKEKLKGVKETLSTFGGTIHDFLFGTEAMDDQEATEGFLSKAYDKIQSIKETLKTFGGTVHDWLFGTEATADQEATEGFLSKAYGKLLEIKDSLKTFGGTVYDFLFGKKATDDQEATEGFLSKVYDKIVAIKDTLKSFGGTVVDWVADLFGVGEAEEAVAEGAGDASDAQDKSNKTLTKLKGIAKAVGSAVSNAFKKAIDWIIKTKDNVIEFWDKFKQTEGYQKLVETFDKVKAKLLEFKDKAIDKIKEAWGNFIGEDFKMPEIDMRTVAESVSDKVTWIIDKVTSFKNTISKIIEDIRTSGVWSAISDAFAIQEAAGGTPLDFFIELFETAKKVVSDFFGLFSSGDTKNLEGTTESLASMTGPVAKNMSDANTEFVKFSDTLSDIKDTILDVWACVMPVLTSFVGLKIGWEVAETFKKIKEIVGSGKQLFDTLTGTIAKVGDATTKKLKSERLRNIAIALGLLAASLWVMAQIPKDKFEQAIWGLVAVTAALSVLMLVASKTIMNANGTGTVLNPLQTLGQSIAEFGKSLSKSLSKFGIAAMIISFALSVKILIGAIKSLGEMDRGTLLQGGIAVIGLMTALATTVTIMSKVGKKKGNLGKAAMILVFAIAIKKVAKVIKDLGKLNEKQLAQGLGAVTVIGLIFAGIIAVTKLMPSGAAALGSIGVLITIAGVFWVMAEAVAKLASLPAENLNNAANALKKLILSVTLMIAAVDLAKGLKDVKATTLLTALAGVAFIVAEVGAELWLLSELPDEQIAKFDPISTALSRMYWSVAGVIAAVALFDGIGNSHGLMSIGEQAKNGAVDIAKTWGIGKAILIIGGIAAVMIGLGAGNAALKEAGGPDVLQALADSLNEWESPLTAIGNAVGRLIGGLVGGVVGGAWEAITGDDLGETIKGWVSSIENLPDMLSTWFTQLNDVTSDMKGQMDSGELNENISAVEQFKTYLDNYVDVANNILAICEAFHAMTKDYNAKYEDAVDMNTGYQDVSIDDKSLSGLFESWANALGTFSSTLVDRGFNAASTQDTITSAKDVLSSFGTLLGEVVKVDDLDSVTDTINSMPGFADALVGYSWHILLLNKGAVDSTKSAAEIILALTDKAIGLGKENHIDDGLLGWAHANGTYLSEYANDLEPFAKGLVRYSEVIKDMRRHHGAVQSTKNAVEIINALAGKAIDTGTKNIITTQSGDGLSYIEVLSNYAGQLESFADGMVTYSQKIAGMNVFAVWTTASAASIITALASAAPDVSYDKGFMGWMTGNKIEDLADNLGEFGLGLAQFSSHMKDFEVGDVEKASDALDKLMKIFAHLQSGEWDEDKPFDLDANSLAVETIKTSLGQLKDYFDKAETQGDLEVLQSSAEQFAMAILLAIDTGLGTGLNATDNGQKSISSIFSDAIAGDKVGTEVYKGVTGMLSEKMPDAVTAHFTANETKYATIVTTYFVPALATGLTDGSDQMTTAISTLMKSVTGWMIGMGLIRIKSAAGMVVTSVETTFRAHKSKFNQIGRDWMDGLLHGLQSKEHAITAWADSFATSVHDAMANATETESPSKLFARLGGYWMEGLSLGVRKKSGLTYDAIDEVSEQSMSEITTALAAAYLYINQVVQQAMDSTPTITPVLDLSQLQNGMGYMNSMIGQNQFLNSNLHYAMSAFPGSYSYGNTQMSYDNSSMIDALNGVREDIKTLGEEMSNMKMVLDSGALVGSIGTGVDQKLGNIQKFKERWA